jgi:hypothetical protein
MQTLQGIHFVYFCFGFHFSSIAYQGKDIAFRFIIKYNSLMDFGHHVVGLFLYEYFWKILL